MGNTVLKTISLSITVLALTMSSITSYAREPYCFQLPTSHVIVIDPGHQEKGNAQKEPIGPGSKETKAKVTTGAVGTVSKLPESLLCLSIGLKLQAELESRGYTVIMTRTENDVDISNSERAEVANASNAEAFIRIHANGSDDKSVSGAMTICQTDNNPFNGAIAESCYELSKCTLDGLTAETGCKKLSIMRTDNMSGINWSKVPVTIVEVGFMSNPNEDKLMATDEYQNSIATGIANGVDNYFSNK